MYRPPELQDLILEYLSSPVEEERTEIGRDMVQLMYDECMAIPLWQGASAFIMQPYVHGTRYSDPLCPTPWDYSSVWLEPEE
jgi:ABC-type transport system substrate-binding protein